MAQKDIKGWMSKHRKLLVALAIVFLFCLSLLTQDFLQTHLKVTAEEGHSQAHAEEEERAPDSEGKALEGVPEGNLVVNYGFEVGTYLEIYGWEPSGTPAGTAAYRDHAVKHSGLSSATVESSIPSNDQYVVWASRLNVIPAGYQVQFKGYIRTEGLTGRAFLQVSTFKITDSDTRVLATYSLDSTAPFSDWTLVEKIAYIPAETNFIVILVGLTGSGRAWFDDLYLEVTAP
jgi:hypothetical protein